MTGRTNVLNEQLENIRTGKEILELREQSVLSELRIIQSPDILLEVQREDLE